jgi:integrase
VRSVLKRAKRWPLIEGKIKVLPVHHQIGRAMTDPEKEWLERIAVTNPAWQNARIAMVLALNTTMRGCELKGLCWRDVDLKQRTMSSGKAKLMLGVG